MSEKHKVDLHLTSNQKNKYVKGLPFQMTAEQCSSKSGKHHICAYLSKKDYNNLLKKNSHKKGMRFSKDTFLEGSGMFKDLMKGVAKVIAPIAIDKIGDATNTRNLTDSLLKPNADKIIDFAVGSGLEIDPMKSTVMPKNKLLRSNDMRLAVMPNENTGLGLKKKKARFVKGSIEAKQFMASIRKGKGIKCGGNVFDDLGKKLKETFNPDLGRKIKDALTSDTAKNIYKEVSNIAIPLIAASTGNPLLGQIAKVGADTAIDSIGSGLKKNRRLSTNIKSSSSTLIAGVPQIVKSRSQGGSFKGL